MSFGHMFLLQVISEYTLCLILGVPVYIVLLHENNLTFSKSGTSKAVLLVLGFYYNLILKQLAILFDYLIRFF